MKKIFLIIICLVLMVSCQNVDNDEARQSEDNQKKIEEKIRSTFLPVDSPITKMLHTNGWKKAYDFYVNEMSNYKYEDYYQVGKISLMGKVLVNNDFKNNPDQEVLNKFLNDIFSESLPASAMIVKIINIYEQNPQMSIKELKSILSKNADTLKKMSKTLKKIRKSGYKQQMKGSNLSVPNFEEKVSQYFDLD